MTDKTGTGKGNKNKNTSAPAADASASASAAAGAAPAATRKTVTYKDVALAFLMEGAKGLENLKVELGGTDIPENVLWTAIESMKASNQDTAKLREFAVSLYGEPSTGQRGRVSPKIGDKRVYKVQKLDKGEEFLRLPIGALKVAKGAGVNVEYLDGRIVITPAPAGAVADDATA